MSAPLQHPFPIRRGDFLYLLIVVLIGLVLRLDLLIANHFVIDSDEAIVGLMAKHINDGGPIPVFYYGQHYMGSFEPLVTAVAFMLFGVSEVVLKCVPLFFSLLLIVAVFFLAREVGTRVTAYLSALFCALPTMPLVVWSSMARGGFIEIVLLGALTFIATCRWLRADTKPLALTALIGALSGFGWWVNNQIIYFILPIGFTFVAALLRHGRRTRKDRVKGILLHASAGLLSFVFGSLPFWSYNLTHHFASFEMLGGARGRDIGEHLYGLFSVSLPILLGGKRFWQINDFYPHSSAVALTLASLLLLIIVAARWRQIVRLFALSVDPNGGVELLLLFVFASLSVFSLSSFGYLVEAPRYLLPLYVAVFVLYALSISIVLMRSRWCGSFLIAAVLSVSLLSQYLGGRAIPGEPFVANGERVAKDHRPLIAWLRERNIDYVRTNYWIGYRLAFETNEQIRFLRFGAPETVRIPAYEEIGRQRDPDLIPMVLVPSQAPLVRKALHALNISFNETRLGDYLIVHDLQKASGNEGDLIKIAPENFAIHASLHEQDITNAVDGNIATRWGSGEHQHGGMHIVISMRKPRPLRAIRYELGAFYTDYPRLLRVEIESPTGERTTVIDPADWDAIRFYVRDSSHFFFALPAHGLVSKLILSEEGEDPIFDWSVTELTLFEAR